MLKFTRQLITPAIAEAYLQANISNRRIKIPTLYQYTQEIIAGKWKEDTGEPIKLSASGVVLDGQHRLLAIVKANKAVWMHVCTNVPDEVFDVLDSGAVRNATDAFYVKGILNGNMIPSIISTYNQLKANRRTGLQKHHKQTNAALLDQYYENEKMWQEIAYASKRWYLAFAKIVPPSLIGGMYKYLSDIDQPKAEQFMSQLCTGISVTNKTVSLLRNKLMQDKVSLRKMPPSLKIAFFIKTWNAFIRGDEAKILKFNASNDEYPTALTPKK